MIALRPYQTELVSGIRGAFRAGHRRVLAVSPTGSGKTVTFAYITHAAAGRGNSALIVAHRQEIVRQISDTLTAFGVGHGLVMPGEDHTDRPIQVAMIQTVGRRFGRISQPKLLVIDESHHAAAGTYQKLLDAWPDTRVLGVTATPQRLDGRGLGEAFDTMVVGPAISDLICGGHLADYDLFAPPPQADLSGVSTVAGDYHLGQLSQAMDRPTITGDAIEHYRLHLDGRPALVFCSSIAHAEHVAADFAAAGYRSASIDGRMPRDIRRDRISALADGRLSILTACDVVSEGTDIPVCAGAILLRPTKSLSLYLQQVGRALRPKPDGSRAVILDHVGNVDRHGMPCDPRAWSLEGRAVRQDDAPGIRQCLRCYRVVPAGKAIDCDDAECPLRSSSAGDADPQVRTIEGTLARRERNRDPLAWAGGIPLTARGRDFYRLIDRAAGDIDRLRMISRARGYRKGWPQHQARQYAAAKGGANG